MKVNSGFRSNPCYLLSAVVPALLLALVLGAPGALAGGTRLASDSPLLTPGPTDTFTPTLTPTPTGPHWDCPAPVVTPTSIHVPYDGGPYIIQVSVGPNCNWRTYWFTGDDWLSFYCGGSGTGPGTIGCNFGNNPQPFTRFGRIYACTSQNDLSQ